MHYPLLIYVKIRIPLLAVLILDDAARRDIRQSEGLRQHLQPALFYDCFVERLALEINDAAVRPDCPRLPAFSDARHALRVGNFNVAVLGACLRKDFYPYVLGNGGLVFVNRALAIENHRVRTRAFRIVLHRQVFR